MQQPASLQVTRLSTPSLPSAVPQPHLSRNLDLLRAVAVLCVVVSHLLDTVHLGRHGSLGRFGVILFFFHTSLVLIASLDRMHTVALSWRLTLGFYLRRIFRIYPLAVLLVLSVWLFHLPPYPGIPFSHIAPARLVSNLLLVQNMTYQADVQAPLWTLPLEVQMYVLLPLLFFVTLRRRYAAIWLWAISVLLAIYVPLLSERLNVFRYAPCFVAGVLAFDLVRTLARGRFGAWLWPVTLLLTAVLFGPVDNLPLPAKIGRAWLCSLLLGLVYPFVQECRPYAGERVTQWIAEHSYGIYLCHGLLLWMSFDLLPSWASWPVFLLTLVLLPAGLYRWIERPLMLAGAHLSRRMLRSDGPVQQAAGIR